MDIWRCTSDIVTAAAAAMASRLVGSPTPLDWSLAAPNIALRSNWTEACE